VDLVGKGGHIRTVPIPAWAKAALDVWVIASGVATGRIFRAVARTGKVWGRGISQNVVWYVVRTCAVAIRGRRLVKQQTASGTRHCCTASARCEIRRIP
jgi:hypothetical protein